MAGPCCRADLAGPGCRADAAGPRSGQYDCISLGASRVHWSVRQTCAEAFGCSVRRCGQLVAVSLEPTVRELLSTSFLKTARDRPVAAESESSVHAALGGVPQLRAPCTRRTAGLRMSRERPVTHQGETAMEGVPLSGPRARGKLHEENVLSGDTRTAAEATTTETQRQRPATTRAAPKAANNPNHGGAQPDHDRAQRPPGQHRKRPATPTAGRPPPPGSGTEAASKAPAEDRSSTTAAEAAAPGRQVQ